MKTEHAIDKNFSKLRAFFWPIYSHELEKITPMFALFFLISFVYHLLRCLKIAIVVKAPGSGAVIIPFLKVWFVLPSALIFSYFYSYLSSKYPRNQVVSKCLTIFVGFFCIFTWILFPFREQLSLTFPDGFLPAGLYGLSQVFKHWPLALLYVFAEMWSIMVLAVLFWGFANEITKVNEAKRFYAFIALGANCAAIFSGEAVKKLSLTKTYAWIPYGTTATEQTVFLFMLTAIILTLTIIWLFNWINKQAFVPNASEIKKLTANKPKKIEKVKYSWKNKITYLIKTPELGYLTLIVLAYNIVSNLADMIWNYQLDIRFTDTRQILETLGNLDKMVGITSVIFAIFGFSNVIRKFGWKGAAIITPAVWAITTILVFSTLTLESNLLDSSLLFFSQVPIHELIINLFLLQMCFGKASKYTFFDQSKEIAFIPLPAAERRKGKAIIDGITSRFGKSGSAIYFQFLLIFCHGEIAKTIPYAGIMILIMLGVWLFATIKLGNLLEQKILTETIDSETKATENLNNSSTAKSTNIAVV